MLYPWASTPCPSKKTLQDADSLLFGVVYRTYIHYFLLNFIAHANSTRKCNKACLLLYLLQFSTKYPLILCRIRLYGIAVNRWRMAITKIVDFFMCGTLCIVARSREESRSLSLATFLARSRSRLQV